MKKYSANYAHTNSNFVIQNLVEREVDHPIIPLLKVLKNILQRGCPTMMSRFLQERLSKLHSLPDFKERIALISLDTPKWHGTIKGDEAKGYFPAREFLERIIPGEFGEFAFVQALMVPELSIHEIVGEETKAFTHQQVDFYLPQARLVIEIDGQQHKQDVVVAAGDAERDKFLASKGIRTVRIATKELQNGTYDVKVAEILAHLESYAADLEPYRETWENLNLGVFAGSDWDEKLVPTAIIRFQILVLELLMNGSLTLEAPWRIALRRTEDFGDFAGLAIKDLQIWLGQLWRLRFKDSLVFTEFEVTEIAPSKHFGVDKGAIRVDFSVLERYTDACVAEPNVVFVRTDYFEDADRNYFKVSCAQPINYDIKKEDQEVLAFFLRNIFDKDNFRDGQFPILSNALNLRDTIGLLPTGGGKSLCYQLPCLLQPSVNFVVCPIKSLMKDQADNLANSLITNVAYISSDLTREERLQAEANFGAGQFLFAFISPERLQIEDFRMKILAIQAKYPIAYAVIDEVHCLSEWGHSFRTSYLNLAKTIDKLSPKDENGEGCTKFIGLTATASVNVLKDIKVEFSRKKGQLQDENIKSLLDYSRKELVFQVEDVDAQKLQTLRGTLSQLESAEGLISTNEKAALVFTPHVNSHFGCYNVSNELNTTFPGKCNWYSGEVPEIAEVIAGIATGKKVAVLTNAAFKNHKEEVQRDFKASKFPLMVATKAFGMGIDKSNIQYTFHYGLPSSVEALYQEAGRAGRWDKSIGINEGRTATCYVLYSKETVAQKHLPVVFDKDTSFAKMKAIQASIPKQHQKDIFRQLFLFLMRQVDVEEELKIVVDVAKTYCKKNGEVLILYADAKAKLGIDEETLQTAIYRLNILGVVSDWTTDFQSVFTVQVARPNSAEVVKCVAKYINKYEPSRPVFEEIMAHAQDKMLEPAGRFLLTWIFENITYNRKQSLKTLMDFCDDFQDSDSFKRRLDNYFKFTEWTFILQHISEDPKDYSSWFDVLTIIERDTQNVEINRIYLPEIENTKERQKRFEALRDAVSRFLESYRSNPGLNLLSGLTRLFLNQYQDGDGIDRFEDAMRQINTNFTDTAQEEIIDRLVAIGKNLGMEGRSDMCKSICMHFPERFEAIAIELDLLHLLQEIIDNKVTSLKSLNQKLYEHIAKI